MLNSFTLKAKLLNIFTEHNNSIYSIDYSTFDELQLIYSGSRDNTIRVWDVDYNKQIQSFKLCHYHNYQHIDAVCGIEFSSFNGGRHLCSGSADKTIRIWYIKTTKQLTVFKGHKDIVIMFNGHKHVVCDVEYSPFVIKNNDEVISDNSTVICSGSVDNTIRSTKNELYVIKGDEKEDDGIFSFKFVLLKKKVNNNEQNLNYDCSVHLCYYYTNAQFGFVDEHKLM
ncbi:WD-40 repeat protein [Reticulomyxa filosa]|uniref:WD-40 repeat protein n=1 Tax=Reticulomyxa filosa TaxID=46433 RepID=X6M421_RETFI|nr:WD-40 repeat protein [Reticulomyxa filosa]|eukprot:ETO07775.1 WD-40 repeat protein [Reticulomyxa filosa]